MGFCWQWLSLCLLVSSRFLLEQCAPSIPLAVSEGRCQFVMKTADGQAQWRQSQWVLVLGSLASPDTLSRIHIQTDSSKGPEFIPREVDSTSGAWRDSN